VIQVRDLVGLVRDLRLEGRLGAPLGNRNRVLPVAAVLQDPFAGLEGEVQPAKGEVAIFEPVDDSQRLPVVIEAPVVGHQLVEHMLAGVAEGRVTEIVGEHDRLGEVLVQAQAPRQGARDLAALERVGEAVAVVVALVEDEHLGLVLQAAKGPTVDDPVAVAREGRTIGVLRLRMEAAAAVTTAGRDGEQALVLLLLRIATGTQTSGAHPPASSRRMRSSSAFEASSISPWVRLVSRASQTQLAPSASTTARTITIPRFNAGLPEAIPEADSR
jgi:hypothetical protein